MIPRLLWTNWLRFSRHNEIRDITVLHMTVPCCSQLEALVAEAVKRSGKDVPQKSYVVGIDGKLFRNSIEILNKLIKETIVEVYGQILREGDARKGART